VMVNMNNGDKDEGQEVDGSEWCGSCMLEVEVEEVEVE